MTTMVKAKITKIQEKRKKKKWAYTFTICIQTYGSNYEASKTLQDHLFDHTNTHENQNQGWAKIVA